LLFEPGSGWDDHPWWGNVGAVSLAIFGLLLTRSKTAFAGRAFAAYGGV